MKLSNNYSIQGFQGKEQEKTKKVNGFIPTTVSALASAVPIFLTGMYTDDCVIPALRVASDLPDEVVGKVHSGARKALKNEGLDKYGVSIQLMPKLEQEPSIKARLLNPILQVKAGMNSLFVYKDIRTFNEFDKLVDYKKNTIFLPEKKSCLTVFHEMGHAANCNMSKLTKYLQYGNAWGQKIGILPVLYTLFTRESKPDKNGNLTTGQKVKNFVRDNVGVISFACFVPSLIEEGLASIRGNSFAKKVLTPDLVKKVAKANIMGYSTYVLSAIGTAVAGNIAVSIKDKMIANKEAKVVEKLNSVKV